MLIHGNYAQSTQLQGLTKKNFLNTFTNQTRNINEKNLIVFYFRFYVENQ